MKFREHGQFVIGSNGNVIYLTVKGQVNRETMQRCAYELKLHIEILESRPFSMLLDLRNFGGGPPEVWEQIKDFNHWLSTQPLIAKAIVCQCSIVSFYAEKTNKCLIKDKIRIFCDDCKARCWLKVAQLPTDL